MSFPHLVYYGSVYSVLLPLLAAFTRLQRLDATGRWILALVAVASVPQILPLYFPVLGANTLYNVYTLIEFGILFQVFRLQLQHRVYRRAMIISAVLYSLLAIFLIGSSGIEAEFLNELVCLNGVLYLFWSLLYIRWLALGEEAAVFETTTPFFWFFTGILIYAPCTIVVLALDSRINANPASMLQHLRTIHGLFNISMYVCFAIGMLKSKEHRAFIEPHSSNYAGTH